MHTRPNAPFAVLAEIFRGRRADFLLQGGGDQNRLQGGARLENIHGQAILPFAPRFFHDIGIEIRVIGPAQNISRGYFHHQRRAI